MAAVKLTEIGPRMTLSLIKVEEGLCSGEVLYHQHVTKTEEEVLQLRKESRRREQIKATRKAQQKRNVDSKREASSASTSKAKSPKRGREDEGDEDHPLRNVKEREEWSDDDDEAYYKKEVGEDAEAGTLRRKDAAKISKAPRTEPPKKKFKKPEGAVSFDEMMAKKKNLKLKRDKQKSKLRQRSKGKKKK